MKSKEKGYNHKLTLSNKNHCLNSIHTLYISIGKHIWTFIYISPLILFICLYFWLFLYIFSLFHFIGYPWCLSYLTFLYIIYHFYRWLRFFAFVLRINGHIHLEALSLYTYWDLIIFKYPLKNNIHLKIMRS
jgi:hypothetical protein